MTSVADKLRIRPGTLVRVIDPPPGIADALGPLPSGARLTEDPAPADAVLLFVRDAAALRARLPGAVPPGGEERLMWVAYPKGGSRVATDLNRDRVAAAVVESGVTAVTQVAIDQTWSALRLRPSERYRS